MPRLDAAEAEEREVEDVAEKSELNSSEKYVGGPCSGSGFGCCAAANDVCDETRLAVAARVFEAVDRRCCANLRECSIIYWIT